MPQNEKIIFSKKKEKKLIFLKEEKFQESLELKY